jgi:His-Xaa-Ser system protein HxsD
MNIIELNIDSKLYSDSIVTKSLYWLTDKYIPEVSLNGQFYNIIISRIDNNQFTEEQKKEVINKLKSNLIDFKLREQIDKETKNIRELIIAKAFSHGEFEEIPPGEISDPVGFKIDK